MTRSSRGSESHKQALAASGDCLLCGVEDVEGRGFFFLIANNDSNEDGRKLACRRLFPASAAP